MTTKNECQFKVGQKVTVVWDRQVSKVISVSKVTTVPKQILLSDGSKWRWDGRDYERSKRQRGGWRANIYSGPTIRHTVKADDVAIEQASLARRCSGAHYQDQWEKLSLEQLRTVIGFLDEAKERG